MGGGELPAMLGVERQWLSRAPHDLDLKTLFFYPVRQDLTTKMLEWACGTTNAEGIHAA